MHYTPGAKVAHSTTSVSERIERGPARTLGAESPPVARAVVMSPIEIDEQHDAYEDASRGSGSGFGICDWIKPRNPSLTPAKAFPSRHRGLLRPQRLTR